MAIRVSLPPGLTLCRTVCQMSIALLWCSLNGHWFVVGLFVKVVEEQVEEDGIWHCEADSPPRVTAISVEELGRVQEGHAELDLEEETKRVIVYYFSFIKTLLTI